MDLSLAILIGIVILGVLFFVIFWKPIAELIRKIRNIGKGGINFGGKQEEELNPESTGKTVEELTRTLNSQLLEENAQFIRGLLAGWKLNDKDSVEVLVKHYSALQIAYIFEQIYRLIFGSQLNALDFLNTQPTAQPREAVRIFYTLAASQYPEYYRSYSFEDWLGFMKQSILVREDAGLLHITVMGREFLTHLTKAGLSRNKAG